MKVRRMARAVLVAVFSSPVFFHFFKEKTRIEQERGKGPGGLGNTGVRKRVTTLAL
jgi:hypothetical protein